MRGLHIAALVTALYLSVILALYVTWNPTWTWLAVGQLSGFAAIAAAAAVVGQAQARSALLAAVCGGTLVLGLGSVSGLGWALLLAAGLATWALFVAGGFARHRRGSTIVGAALGVLVSAVTFGLA